MKENRQISDELGHNDLYVIVVTLPKTTKQVDCYQEMDILNALSA